ncbi:MAG: hypothetical protein RMM53_06640 [Bacteroidia bacterium]|nr:hypothetical protein [Bacteroidia bacterium]
MPDGGERIERYRAQIAVWLRYRVRISGVRKNVAPWFFGSSRRYRTVFALLAPGLWLSVGGSIYGFWADGHFWPGGRLPGLLITAMGGWWTHIGLRALTVRDTTDIEAECIFVGLTTPAGTPQRFLQYLSHPNVEFRFAALTALSRRGAVEPRLASSGAQVAVAFLSDKSLERRKIAYDYLFRHARDILREKLPRLLEHPSFEVRMTALGYVQVFDSAQRIAALQSRLSDLRAEVVAVAVKLLRETPRTVEEYLNDLYNGTTPVKTMAAEYFAEHTDARALEGLKAMSRSSDPRQWPSAVAALGRMDDVEAEAALCAFCCARRVELCITDTSAVRKIFGKSGEVVKTIFDSEYLTQRRTALTVAIEALVRLADIRPLSSETIDVLLDLTKDTDAKIVEAAVAALYRLGQSSFLCKLYESGDTPLRKAVLRCVLDSDDETYLPLFRQGLQSSDAKLAKAAIAAFGRMVRLDSDDALALCSLLNRADASIVGSVLDVLAKVGTISTLAHLDDFGRKIRSLQPLLVKDGGELHTIFGVRVVLQKASHAAHAVASRQKIEHRPEDCYCRRCHARFRRSFALGNSYLECKQCRDDRFVVAPVKKAVGFVGGVFSAGLFGEIFYVRLWNEASKTAVYAEIDEWILSAGDEISYDWAVNAVVQMLQDTRQNVPVNIVGEPPLSTNSLTMLTANAASVVRT